MGNGTSQETQRATWEEGGMHYILPPLLIEQNPMAATCSTAASSQEQQATRRIIDLGVYKPQDVRAADDTCFSITTGLTTASQAKIDVDETPRAPWIIDVPRGSQEQFPVTFSVADLTPTALPQHHRTTRPVYAELRPSVAPELSPRRAVSVMLPSKLHRTSAGMDTLTSMDEECRREGRSLNHDGGGGVSIHASLTGTARQTDNMSLEVPLLPSTSDNGASRVWQVPLTGQLNWSNWWLALPAVCWIGLGSLQQLMLSPRLSVGETTQAISHGEWSSTLTVACMTHVLAAMIAMLTLGLLSILIGFALPSQRALPATESLRLESQTLSGHVLEQPHNTHHESATLITKPVGWRALSIPILGIPSLLFLARVLWLKSWDASLTLAGADGSSPSSQNATSSPVAAYLVLAFLLPLALTVLLGVSGHEESVPFIPASGVLGGMTLATLGVVLVAPRTAQWQGASVGPLGLPAFSSARLLNEVPRHALDSQPWIWSCAFCALSGMLLGLALGKIRLTPSCSFSLRARPSAHVDCDVSVWAEHVLATQHLLRRSTALKHESLRVARLTQLAVLLCLISLLLSALTALITGLRWSAIQVLTSTTLALCALEALQLSVVLAAFMYELAVVGKTAFLVGHLAAVLLACILDSRLAITLPQSLFLAVALVLMMVYTHDMCSDVK